MKAAAHGSTTGHGPVIETRPARIPFKAGKTSGGFFKATWIARVVHPPVAAASVVVTATRAASPMYSNGEYSQG